MTMPTDDAQTSPPAHDSPTPPLPHTAADTAADTTTDLDAVLQAMDLLEHEDGGPNAQTVQIRHLCAELAATRAERDRLSAELAAVQAEAERARSLLPYPGVLDEAGNIVRRAGYGPMADSLQVWGACIRGFYEREARGE